MKRIFLSVFSAVFCGLACSSDIDVLEVAGAIERDTVPVAIDSANGIRGSHASTFCYLQAHIFSTVDSPCWTITGIDTWNEGNNYFVRAYVGRDSGALCPYEVTILTEEIIIPLEEGTFPDSLHLWQTDSTSLSIKITGINIV